MRHALAVRGAIASNNYFRFFQLYRDVPNKGIYLMNHFVSRGVRLMGVGWGVQV